MSIVEVAKLAGCSHTTVSRVINQQPGVSDDAAARVRAAMRRLNYVPPVKRRGPQPKRRKVVRTGNVAVLMFGTDATPLTAPVTAAAIHAVEEALATNAYSMTLGQVRDESRLPSVVQRGDIDGLILHGNPPSPELAERLQRFPAVWMMSPRSRTGYWGDRVAPDNHAIGAVAADYLIQRGHRRVAFLAIDAAHLGFGDRLAAFEQAATSAGLACDIVRTEGGANYQPGDFRAVRQHVDRLVEAFAQLDERPTGVFVPRGQAILMVFEALRSRGIEPGRDVTIIACDNDPALAGLNPQIATVDVRPDRIGRAAVDQLLRRIEKPDLFSKASVLTEPTLIEPRDTDSVD